MAELSLNLASDDEIPKPEDRDWDLDFNLCPEQAQLDFKNTSYKVKQAVFWFSIPMLVLNFLLVVTMLVYICTRTTRFYKASWLTKVQFIFIIGVSLFSSLLLAVFTYS